MHDVLSGSIHDNWTGGVVLELRIGNISALHGLDKLLDVRRGFVLRRGSQYVFQLRCRPVRIDDG